MENTRFYLNRLKRHLPDISDIYTPPQLKLFYEAIYGEAEIKMPKAESQFFMDIKVEKKVITTNRKKVRIDITQDLSYVTPLLEHLCKYDEIEVKEIKTGLAIKHKHNDYLSNIINYNELRTINGVVFGNLYFNVIRNDEEFNHLNIDEDIKWFRGFAMLNKVCIYDVLEFLTDDNMNYLRSLNKRSNKRRLTNKNKLVGHT